MMNKTKQGLHLNSGFSNQINKRFWFDLKKTTHAIGFGCWQIAGVHSVNGKPNGWGAMDENVALDILTHAIDSGIDFFDTAQGYNNGHSERMLGKAIKHCGKDVVVCSKISLTEDELAQQKISDNFCERLQTSLQNLRADRIDILLIHNPPDELDWKSFDFSVLDGLKSSGEIGTYGVSSRGLKGAQKAAEAGFGSTIEWVLNLFERRPVKELFPMLEQKEMNFIARSPLSRGLINPKYITDLPIFSNNDFRSTLPEEWVQWVIDSLRKYRNNGIPLNEIVRQAILYCLQYESVKSCIIGIRTREQLEDLLKINESAYSRENFQPELLDNIPGFFPKWA